MVFFLVVISKIVEVQYFKKDTYTKIADNETIKEHVIKSRRGNIYTEDGNLLATSITKYDVAIDPSEKVISKKLFNENIQALSDSIYTVFGAYSKHYYAQKINKARNKGKQYVSLRRNLTFDQFQRIKSFPILNKGRFKGGLIVEERMVREHPLGKVAERTIGYDEDKGDVGLESAFSRYLSGRDGSILSQRLKGGVWKPLTHYNQTEPIDGADVFSTIDVHIQDVAHFALLRQLEKFKAHHGTVVVMEVKTGKIKGIVNLARTEKGKYYEKRNYAVYESIEPGSTFKLPIIIAALEDGIVDTSKVYDTEKGKFKVYNKTIRDSHNGGFGKISLRDVFVESSNIGMAKMVLENYKSNPSTLLQRLYSMGLDKKTNVSIQGEGNPLIPSPGTKNWSGLSLPWMAYGYGVYLTPLQLLTFYNAIANDGVEVKPYLVSKIRDEEGELSSVGTTVINPRICSKETVEIAQDLLENVVLHGTGQGLKMKNLKIAGKTGTTQLEYWKTKEYSSSFVGYFPAENPKYSIIVVVTKPDQKVGYYGAQVAGPVFKEIAVKIFTDGPEVKNENPDLTDEELRTFIGVKNKDTAIKGLMPNVKGLPGMDALAILENAGLHVYIKGSGKVVRQSISPGKRVRGNNKVTLVLM